VTALVLKPGTVLLTRSKGWQAFLIRLGAAFRDRPNRGNHIAVMHHYDAESVPWGVEGRPGGVGWVDLRAYLASKWTLRNDGQPIGDRDRATIAQWCELALKTPYDWPAIAAATLDSLGLPAKFAENWHGAGAPGMLVCSSLAAAAYGHCGVAHPKEGHERTVTPAHWAEWIITEGWTPAE
jgi:hypothetical protein